MKRTTFTLFLLANVAGGPLATADELGRLFLTQFERDALQRDRMAGEQPAPTAPVVEQTSAAPVPEDSPALEDKPVVHLDGFVKRDGTSGTVWINGVNTYDGDLSSFAVDQQRVRVVGDRVRVPALDDEQVVLLKPGQGFDPNRQEVTDSYHLSRDD